MVEVLAPPGLVDAVAWSFAPARGEIQTSFQAGGITSCSMRSIFVRILDPLGRARPGSESAPSTPRASIPLCAPRADLPDRREYHPPPMDQRTIVVLEGDETGQELLEEGLRTLAPDVIGIELAFPRFDLSLPSGARPRTRSSTKPRARSGSTGSA